MNLLRATRSVISALVISAGLAGAQEGPKPDIVPTNAAVQAAEVRPGDGVFRFAPAGERDLAVPADMPPLRDIPPVPMDAGGYRGGEFKQNGGHFIMFDPATGQVQDGPASIVHWKNDVSGGGFTGAFAAGAGEDSLPTDWAGTLSAVSDANLSAWPYRANCKVAIRFVNTSGGSSWGVCSGTMIDAETVLTAGHCVYTRSDGLVRGFAAEMYVFPGWDGSGDVTTNLGIYNAWGAAQGETYATWSSWADDGDTDGDIGLVRVNRAAGMLTGWYGWNYGNSCATIQDRTYNNVSYPAEPCGGGLHTGAQMYYWFGTVDGCPSNQLYLNTVGGCLQAVWGGMSGSSLYYIDGDGRYASAVCSTSNRSTSAHYCRLFEGIVTYMNDTFIPNARTSSFDLQPLDCNMSDTSHAAGAVVPASTFDFLATNATNANPASQTYSFNIYLSSNADISASDTLLSQQSYTFDYGAMQNIRVHCGSFTIPLTVAPGTYYIGVVLDTGTGGDSTAGNNDSDYWDAVQITVTGCVTPPAPAGVYSTNYQYCDHNELNWTASDGASYYQVYRATTDNSGAAVLLGTDTASPYNDTTAASGVVYYYWVKAVYPCGTSGFSLVADGIRNSTPPTPAGVLATDSTLCGSVSVSWDSAARADDYLIYRNTTNSTSGATLLGTDTASPYSDATGNSGQVYYYFVRARNECGTSGYSASNAGSEQYTPLTPASVAASDGTVCTGVQVVWSSVSNARTYSVYRNTTNNAATAVLITSGLAVTNTVDATAVLGTTYFYWVRANNECGLGGYSTPDSGYRGTVTAAPTGVSASDGPICTPAITVTWVAAPGAISHTIFRNTINNSATATSLVTMGAPIVTYDDAGALVGQTYYYWVKANNACGASAFSAPDTGTRGGVTSAPTNVTATDGTRCNSVVVSWVAPAGATGYEIWRSTINESRTAVRIGTDTASPYVDGTVVGATVYYYWVKATSSCGTSVFSASNSGFGGTGVVFDTQPVSLTVFEGQDAVFTVDVGGASTYRWRKNGVNISDGFKYSGAGTDTLTVMSCSQADEGNYTCYVTSPCGDALSNNARLMVDPLPCPADYNQDGGIDGSDVSAFFYDWEAGLPGSDVNYDGGIDGSDVDYFFAVWEAGGCS